MATFNKIILIGSVEETPEILVTTTGDTLAKFKLVVNRPEGASGFSQTDTIQIVAWRNTAEKAKSFQQNQTVLVEGRILTKTYDTAEGVRKWETEVEARDIKEITGQMSSAAKESETSEFSMADVETLETGKSLEEKPTETLKTDFDFEEKKESNQSESEEEKKEEAVVTPPDFSKEIEEDIPF